MNIQSSSGSNIDGYKPIPQENMGPTQVTASMEAPASQPQITSITQLFSKLGSALTSSALDTQSASVTSGFKTYL